MADFSDDLQPEVELETWKLLEEEHKVKWTLFTNEASNQRGTSLGIILKLPQGYILPQEVICEFNATNDEDEYEALIMGLQLAKVL